MAETTRNIEYRYRLLVENLTDYAVFMTDPQGQVKDWNEGAQQILGYSESEIIGQSADVIFTPEDRERGVPRAEMETARRVGRATDERWHLRKDRSRFFASGVLTAVNDTSGQLIGFAKVMRDFTERKRAESRLVTEHAVSRVLAEAATLERAIPAVVEAVCRTSEWQCGGLWVVGPDAECAEGLLTWAGGWCDPSGGTGQFFQNSGQAAISRGTGLPGRVWASSSPAWIADLTQDATFLRREAATRAGLHGGIAFPVTSGAKVLGVMEFFSRQVRPPDGPLSEMMAVIGRQVGQFMRRRRAEEGLRASEARNAAILEAALDAIVSMDHQGTVVEWNPAAERTFGYTREEALGREMADLIIPPALRAKHREGLQRYLATGDGRVIGKRLEIAAIGKGGAEFIAELTITRILSDGPPLFTGHLRDISDRKTVERGLSETQRRLQTLFDNTQDAILLSDDDARYVDANPAALALTGYTREELLQRSVWDVTPVPDRPTGERLWQEFIALGRQEGEYPLLRKDRSAVAVEYRAVANILPGLHLSVLREVGDRKRAEESLREAELRYRAIFEATRDGLIINDPDGKVVEANPAACQMHGYTYHEFMRTPPTSFIYPGDLPLFARFIEVAGRGEEFATEARDVRKDGSVFPVEVRGSSFTYKGRRHVLGVVRDITERKGAEAALRESEQRFRFLNDLGEQTRDLSDPEAVMATVARQLGEHLRASRCAYADVEADSEQFTIRHDYTDGCPSTTGQYRLSLFGPRAAADQRSGRTLVLKDVSAELAPGQGLEMFSAIGVAAIVCCPLVRAGRLVAMMAVHQTTPRLWTTDEVSLVEAVVERSWAYVERARVARSLRQSEENLRRLADAMPQIVWAAGPDGVLDYYNRRWFQYVNLPEQAAGDAAWDRYIHPDDLPRAYETWSASLSSGEPYAIEFRVRGADGAYRWFLARALPVRDADARIIRWYGTCTDIHDQKQLQAENEQLLERERAARTEAERNSRMKDEFLATLGHELRTPLNAILGWSHILRSGPPDAQDLAQGLETIDRNARAQTAIIEDLLDMSRIISGKVRLDVRQIDLREAVYAAVETVRPGAEAKGVKLQVVLDPSAAPVSGDAGRLQQVFWNLLSNAVKFSTRGGRVQVLLERVNSSIEVNVIDDGEGIEPEFLPHVFDRFRQADGSATRRHGGLGLGLSIVKQLVELHGGSVRVKSPGRGKGSTFTVLLPLSAIRLQPVGELEPRQPDALSDEKAPEAHTCVKLDGVKVLVVDDEADARALIKRLLQDCKAEVMTASSAAEALEVLRREKPDVLLSDIGMPGEDGYSFIRKVRALGPADGGEIPAVALTAYARSDDRTRAILAGFNLHLSKPVEPLELIATIASLAGRTDQA